jgi:tRNA(fMet)-specific endonuclease VapC
MLAYMLDTNICIYIMLNRAPHLNARFERFAPRIGVSAITVAELYYGIEKSANQKANFQALRSFVDRLEVLSFPTGAAEHYGKVRAFLERAGTPIGTHDLLIGAHARSEGLTLVTNNRREFDRIPGLLVENWV